MTTPRRPPRREVDGRDDEKPVLPDITDDERAIGWGEELSDGSDGRRDEQWYRRERPPHHE